MRVPLSPDVRAWVEALDAAIWTRHEGDRIGPWASETRELTEAEVMRLWKIIRRHELPCVMTNTAFGFRVGMVVYDHAETVGVRPEAIILVSGTQMPGQLHRSRDRSREFKEEFAFFERFTHAEENRQLLGYYGLPEPMSMGHYDY